ncbi:MAG: hypothetical protein GY847_37275 [Proteobacteria bacterium]|nr:hypothetical protein [Pseudomonadota bacterium]
MTLITLGCSSSIAVPKDFDSIGDGGIDGIDLLDASDNRDIPFICGISEECDDSDPCTDDFCDRGKCEFFTKEIELRPVPIVTSGSALDVSLAPGLVYIAEGETGVEIFDISDPDYPQLRGIVDTMGDAIAVDSSERGFVVAQGELGFETFSWPDMRQLVHALPGDERLREVEEVLEVSLGPGYSLAAAYSDGVSVLDLTNLGNPIGVKNIDTPGRAVSAASSKDSSGLVADSLNGAVAIVFHTEEGVVLGGRVLTEGRVVDVDVSGDTALIAEYGVGFGVVDMSETSKPERLASVPSSSPSVSVSLLGTQTGVVVEKNGKVVVYNLQDPLRPALISTWKADAEALQVDTHGGLIALALGKSGAILLQTGCSY